MLQMVPVFFFFFSFSFFLVLWELRRQKKIQKYWVASSGKEVMGTSLSRLFPGQWRLQDHQSSGSPWWKEEGTTAPHCPDGWVLHSSASGQDCLRPEEWWELAQSPESHCREHGVVCSNLERFSLRKSVSLNWNHLSVQFWGAVC